MAYIIPPNDPNAPAPAGAMGAPGAMNQPPTTSAGGTATSASAPGSPQGAAAQPNATQAPPVQDLKAYLAANAPQAVQMGQNIAGDLNTTAGKVTGDINAAQQDVTSQVAAQNTAPDQALVEKAAENPADFVTNDQNVKDFLAQENANYGGPANFAATTEAQPLQTEISNAQSQAPDITKPQGVEQLARGQEKNPTTGMSNLDALLLQESPGALDPVTAALPQFGKFGEQLTGAQSSVDAAIKAAIANDTAAKAGVSSRFLTGPNAVVPTWEKGIADETAAAQKQADAYNGSIQKMIDEQNAMNPTLTDTEAAIKAYNDQNWNPNAAGVSAESKLPGMNFDLSGLTKTPTTVGPATEASVATSKDYANEAALEKLLGSLLGTTPIDQSTAGQAGTYSVPKEGGLPIADTIAGLQAEEAAANAGFTNNGALQYKGTPQGSIVTNADLPPGYVLIRSDALIPQGSHNPKPVTVPGEINSPIMGQNGYTAVPVGTKLPDGKVAGSGPDTLGKGSQKTADTGNTFVPGQVHVDPSLVNHLAAPKYYSNAPLTGADKEIDALIKYLQGMQS